MAPYAAKSPAFTVPWSAPAQRMADSSIIASFSRNHPAPTVSISARVRGSQLAAGNSSSDNAA